MNIEHHEIKMCKPNFNTPPIPSFIFDFKGIEIPKNEKHESARWINAFNDDYLGTSTKNLYPTETLFGDWNGEILILAQDALPASALKKLISTTTQNGYSKEFAWRHANREIHGDKKGYRTNESLRILVNNYVSGYGVLYGSAAAHMLYDDGYDKYRQVLKGADSSTKCAEYRLKEAEMCKHSSSFELPIPRSTDELHTPQPERTLPDLHHA